MAETSEELQDAPIEEATINTATEAETSQIENVGSVSEAVGDKSQDQQLEADREDKSRASSQRISAESKKSIRGSQVEKRTSQRASRESEESKEKLPKGKRSSQRQSALLSEAEDSKEKHTKPKRASQRQSQLLKPRSSSKVEEEKSVQSDPQPTDAATHDEAEQQVDILLIDPETGKPITAEEKKARDRQRHKARVRMRFNPVTSTAVYEMQSLTSRVEEEQQQDYAESDSDVEITFSGQIDGDRSRYRSRSKTILQENVLDAAVEEFSQHNVEGFDGSWSEEDSMPESPIEVPSPGKDSVQLKTNFLNNFEFPELSDVSEEEIQTPIYQTSSHVPRPSHQQDVGVFVDPLTGDILVSSESSEISSESTIVEEEIIASESSGMPDFQDIEEATKETVQIEGDKDREQDSFVNFQQALTYISEEPGSSDEEFEGRNVRKEMAQITEEFLNEVICDVVNHSELHNADKILKAKLDKLKLLETLSDILNVHESEKSINDFLNARTCDYYKRQKIHRVFHSLPPYVDHRERRRYTETLAQLDHMKATVAESKRKNAYLMSSVLMDMQYVSTVVTHTESHLEQVMRRYLIRNNSEYLKRIVERELRLMANKRNEISDARLFLITRKHALGAITEKIAKLEKVSDTLFINDFVAIQNQVVALDKKIEERNNDLKKLLNTYHFELHQIQHNQEKTLVLAKKLDDKKATLADKQKRQWELREILYEEKMQRTRIHQRQKELSFKGGILSMPALMHDYDETLQKVEEKRVSVAKLKESLKALTARVAYYETRNL